MIPMSPLMAKIVGWLRAGYPDGVPEQDYIPLLAVLSRRLSSEEVGAVAASLRRESKFPVDNVDIGVLITRITNELPQEDDVRRVRSRLALAGWPLADPYL